MPQRHKRRFVLFSAKDEAIFSEALRQTFPTLRYLIYSGSRIRPSCLDAFDSLTDVPGRYVHIVVPGSVDWRPMPGFDPRDGGWTEFANLPTHRSLHYYRSVWDWSFYGSERISYDVPTMDHGEIFGSYSPSLAGHEEFLVLVRSVWKIIGCLATNRYNLGHPLGNKLMGREVQLMQDAKGGWIWIGHQALQWCRAHSRRMLSGAFRACDDWEMPESEWYRGLLERIEQRYGIDFGETPPPPWEVQSSDSGERRALPFQLSVVDAEAMRRRSLAASSRATRQ